MPLEGYILTWFKSLGSRRTLEEKLDRAMHTHSWLSMFPATGLFNLVASTSNHLPTILKLEHESHIKPKRSFRLKTHDFSITVWWKWYHRTDLTILLVISFKSLSIVLMIWKLGGKRMNSPNYRETANKLRCELELVRCTHHHMSDTAVTYI
jgi:hypothetical protein